MNICIIKSSEEENFPNRKFTRGRLSYIARKEKLFAEKINGETRGDIMIIASDDMDRGIAPAIAYEYKSRGYSAVFLDSDRKNADFAEVFSDVYASLKDFGINIFCPLTFASCCKGAIPVAEAAVSGGSFSEYITSLIRSNSRIALCIPRISADFSLPLHNPQGRLLSAREAARIMNMHDATPYFSPQLMTNYFIYSPAPGKCNYVLFDDARSISEKIRLAKRFGVSSVFLAFRDISDILNDIIF